MADDDLGAFDHEREIGSAVQGCPANEAQPTPPPNSWIGIEMVDEEGKGVNGQVFEVQVPDGTIVRGETGFGICRPGQEQKQDGRALIEGIDPGTCKIAFVELDRDAWETA